MSVAVYCFSGAGHSLSVAKRIAERLNAPVCLIGQAAFYGAETAVIVFPVYCQNIPTPVRGFLLSVSAKICRADRSLWRHIAGKCFKGSIRLRLRYRDCRGGGSDGA